MKNTLKNAALIVSILWSLIILMNIILLSILHKVLSLRNLTLTGFPSCPQERFFASRLS